MWMCSTTVFFTSIISFSSQTQNFHDILFQCLLLYFIASLHVSLPCTIFCHLLHSLSIPNISSISSSRSKNAKIVQCTPLVDRNALIRALQCIIHLVSKFNTVNYTNLVTATRWSRTKMVIYWKQRHTNSNPKCRKYIWKFNLMRSIIMTLGVCTVETGATLPTDAKHNTSVLTTFWIKYTRVIIITTIDNFGICSLIF